MSLVRARQQQHTHQHPVHHIRSKHLRIYKLKRHLDNNDKKLHLIVFLEMKTHIGPHTIDRFASALNTLLSRYDANMLDPSGEPVDALHLSDAQWRDENNLCSPFWPPLPDLAQKLFQSGAAATVVAPHVGNII
jgi:hypothetical protein